MNYILRDENAVYYECGFSCDNVVFLRLGSEAFFITDARYTTEAGECVKNAQVIEGDRRDLFQTVRDFMHKAKITELIFNPLEWSVAAFARFSKDCDGITFKEELNFSQQKRIIKSQEEQQIIRQAALLGAKAFDNFATYLLENGLNMTEKRAHFEAESIFKDYGELELSFSPIVAFGANAAKPHALPSADTLQQGELILLDAGVKYERFCSDRTRVTQFDENMHFGKTQHFNTALRQKIYDTVKKAQEAGIKKAQCGIKACAVDAACRDVITKAGYGEFFIHSTGHGVGLDIHELPIIGARSETVLEEGMVFTVEPGIYLPSEFGVRIEDTVILGTNGAEVIG